MKRRSMLWVLFLGIAALAVIAIACGDDDDEASPTAPADETPAATEEPTAGSHSQILADVQSADELVCGVNDAVPGFGFVEADGTNSGFDTEFCRAIAAAVLGDATKVQFVPLTAEARLTALQTGEIDVLIRNTTWTITRDAATGLSYAVTTFYDGQGMMVRTDDPAGPFDTVDDLANARICVLAGTTTELNLADRLPDSEVVPFEDNETLQAAFIAEACDGWTSDKSQLASRRFVFPEDAGGPDSLVILDETFSKEPLGPLTIDNDSQWFDIVNWVTIGMIIADEKGITSDNLQGFVDDPDGAETARLLGVPFEGGEIFDPGLGIDPDFMQDVISQVGNYGEVYDDNITPIGIPRAGTLNASFTDGGLIYAPPWR